MAESTQAPPEVGTFCWREILSGDTAKTKKFYTDMFGWSTDEMDMGPAGTYTMFKKGDTHVGGMMAKPPEMGDDGQWVPYVAVDDVDAAAKKAEGLGAKVCVPPTDIPNIGRFSIVIDTTGVPIGLFKA
jgi:predicted enzyme related to lactoylglutathione lyase